MALQTGGYVSAWYRGEWREVDRTNKGIEVEENIVLVPDNFIDGDIRGRLVAYDVGYWRPSSSCSIV